MKKIIFALILCLICSQVLAAGMIKRHIEPETLAYNALSGASTDWFTTNNYIWLIKYSSGITLASIAGKLSVATGALFMTNISQDLRWLAGWSTPPLCTLSDGTNSATFKPSTVGMGETYGSELVTDGEMTSQANWTRDTPPGTGEYWTVAGGVNSCNGTTNVYSVPTGAKVNLYGKCLKYSFDFARTNGNAGIYFCEVSVGLIAMSTPGTYSGRVTINITGDRYLVTLHSNSLFEGSFDNVSLKQILTPDATGFNFTDLAVGSLNINASSYMLTCGRGS